MTVEPLTDLAARLPEWARDLKRNLADALASPNLSAQQLWGVAVASSIAARDPALRAAAFAAAAPHLSEAALAAAKSAAALMGMNNVYYRFTHLVNEPAYQKMPARLRMQASIQSGIERNDFELMALAVSAINGCGICMETHERHLVQHGVTRETVQDAVRLAAVLSGIAAALEADARVDVAPQRNTP
ncbi:MAG TPA: carboxymuconolactone decarboxylase family protein [Stellaceae bacterium]|nr:carboxymuconolactone decarboxylase family protein [Stellaceae bacterium]